METGEVYGLEVVDEWIWILHSEVHRKTQVQASAAGDQAERRTRHDMAFKKSLSFFSKAEDVAYTIPFSLSLKRIHVK